MSKLSTEEMIALYKEGLSLSQISDKAGITSAAILKRFRKVGFNDMRPANPKGRPWAKSKRGKEFLGADGRMWVRGIRSSKSRNSKRKAVVVMEEYLGIEIPKGFHIHHIDGDPLNDDISNLALITTTAHNRIHHKK